ncbi:BrxA family protein [uncultured Cocleimonas sp.]|uniref:BrxA family protein n=1 Tax=uncultured Cocleimonas sp. TaxID=1051587 RepID=UPI00262B3165|nr:BrxA family protein [uncultured Cocleimonas sp.]
MIEEKFYTTQLGAGLGLVGETQSLLDLWVEGMDIQSLVNTALDSGEFPNITARRLRNIVAECFAPRYLKPSPQPAKWLSLLSHRISTKSLNQLFFIYSSRANPILQDFVSTLYWERYASGYTEITNEDSTKFVHRSTHDGKTKKLWSESTIKRQASYLLSICVDYQLLQPLNRTARQITPIRVNPCATVILAYDLHLQGIADNNLINHPDWLLFGLQAEDVRDEIKRLSVHKFWIIQTAADVVSISWSYKTMEEVVDVIIETGL